MERGILFQGWIWLRNGECSLQVTDEAEDRVQVLGEVEDMLLGEV